MNADLKKGDALHNRSMWTLKGVSALPTSRVTIETPLKDLNWWSLQWNDSETSGIQQGEYAPWSWLIVALAVGLLGLRSIVWCRSMIAWCILLISTLWRHCEPRRRTVPDTMIERCIQYQNPSTTSHCPFSNARGSSGPYVPDPYLASDFCRRYLRQFKISQKSSLDIITLQARYERVWFDKIRVHYICHRKYRLFEWSQLACFGPMLEIHHSSQLHTMAETGRSEVW